MTNATNVFWAVFINLSHVWGVCSHCLSKGKKDYKQVAYFFRRKKDKLKDRENSALSFLSYHVPGNLFFSVGKKRPPYPATSRRLYNPSADQPVGHLIDWLLLLGGG